MFHVQTESSDGPSFHQGIGPHHDVLVPGCWFFQLPHKVCTSVRKFIFLLFISVSMFFTILSKSSSQLKAVEALEANERALVYYMVHRL